MLAGINNKKISGCVPFAEKKIFKGSGWGCESGDANKCYKCFFQYLSIWVRSKMKRDTEGCPSLMGWLGNLATLLGM